jgi:hypothetical protein
VIGIAAVSVAMIFPLILARCPDKNATEVSLVRGLGVMDWANHTALQAELIFPSQKILNKRLAKNPSEGRQSSRSESQTKTKFEISVFPVFIEQAGIYRASVSCKRSIQSLAIAGLLKKWASFQRLFDAAIWQLVFGGSQQCQKSTPSVFCSL